MKYQLLIIILLTLLSNISPRLKKLSKKNKTAKDYIKFAKLPYCQSKLLKSSTCSVCKEIGENGYKIIDVKQTESDQIITSMVIVENDKDLVVSFGGPKSTDVAYLQNIYKKGMSIISIFKNKKIETEFWNVYSDFRQELIEKLKNAKGKKIIFVGHSFGGSLALIAAYDVVNNNILDKAPEVFTFGALKFGEKKFSSVIDSTITSLVRINYDYDYYSILPRCVFLDGTVFHCYRNYVSLVRTYPSFGYYYMQYSPIIRTQLVTAIPQIVREIPQPTVINSPTQKGEVHKVEDKNIPVDNKESKIHENPKDQSKLTDVNKNLDNPNDVSKKPESNKDKIKDNEIHDLDNLKKDQRHSDLENPHKSQKKHEDHRDIQSHNEKEIQVSKHPSNEKAITHSSDIDLNDDLIKNKSLDHRNDSINKERLFDSKPLHYSSKHHSSDSDSELNSSRIQERSISNMNESRNFEAPAPRVHHETSFSNNVQKDTLSNHHISNHHEPLQSQLASHEPMQYSGVHSSSINNSNHIMEGSSRMQSHKDDEEHKKHIVTFVEKTEKINRALVKSNRCKNGHEYVICNYDPEVHQKYFGINVEECD